MRSALNCKAHFYWEFENLRLKLWTFYAVIRGNEVSSRCEEGNWDSSVGIVSRLRAGRLRNLCTIPCSERNLFETQSVPPSVCPTRPPVHCVPGFKRPGREADHFRLVPLLRIMETIPPIPSYDIACTKTTLSLPLH